MKEEQNLMKISLQDKQPLEKHFKSKQLSPYHTSGFCQPAQWLFFYETFAQLYVLQIHYLFSWDGATDLQIFKVNLLSIGCQLHVLPSHMDLLHWTVSM